MDGDSPDIDSEVKEEIEKLVHGKQEDVDMVRSTLEKAIYWVKGMTGKWCCYFPRMMRFMDVFVDVFIMFPSVDPVYETVSEQDERNEGAKDAVPTCNKQ